MATEMEKWHESVAKVSDTTNSDLYLFSHSIYDDQADQFVDRVRKTVSKKENVGLILCTNGGNADAGYQIARCLKKNYKKVTLYVFGNCKSTGTLVAVGANEIVMSEFGQFGPLDVQLADKEEFYGQTPALDVSQSIATLSDSAFNCFLDHFLKLEPGRSISTKTASEIAKSLTLGIVEPIASQIDPLLLGRVDRSMKIAEAYIKRLNPNFTESKKLIGGYPSHGFVIDFDEAKEVFHNVRVPTQDEIEIEETLRKWNKVPKQSNWIGLISKERTKDEKDSQVADADGKDRKNANGDGEKSATSGSERHKPDVGHKTTQEPAR